MRNTFLLHYLYICVLSILSQSPSCLTQTANSAASRSDGQIRSNIGPTIELKQSQVRLSDETNQRIQRSQLTDKQTTRDIVRQIRRKRELRDPAGSVRLRGSPSPSGRIGVASGEQRFKKSDHPLDQNLRKLVSKKNNVNQDKRDLHKQRGPASRSSLSTDEDEAKSGPKDAKRSSYSGEAVKVPKPNSRAIKESDSAVAQGSFAKEKLKLQDNEKYATLSDDSKAREPESGNEEPEDGVGVEENSAEYEETGDDDDDRETLSRNSGYKDNNSDASRTGEESEKLDQGQSSSEDDDSERQDIVKRETGVAEEEYEDIEDQDEACEDANLVDESNFQRAKGRSGPELSEERETDDSRVKRQDIETSENVLEKNDASNLNEAANQQLKSFEHLGNAKEDPGDNFKGELSQTALEESSKSSLRPQGRYQKRQVASENLEANEEAEPEANRGNEDNESSKRVARFQQGVQTDNRDKNNFAEQSGENEGSGNPVNEEVKKEAKMATESKSDVEDDGKGSKQESNLDATAKDDESNSDYEKKVEEQIQQKIESIKEQIKREVEEKQRIREIEANNAKYDEIQSEIEEDEDEDNQSLDIPSERRSLSKRSIIDSIRSPETKTKRHILRRVKRSDTTDARQLRAIEGVEKLEPDVFAKARLRHESIRKRSAPIYGAADKDAADTSKPLMKRSANPRRVYLVSNERKRSPEVRDAIIIPEQAHVNIEDELPPGLSLDPKLLEDSSSPANYRMKRSPDRFARRRRASALVPEGRVAFLGYRPQDDDENDEGSEFDDDGFEDRTSNLQQDKVRGVSQAYLHDQYHADELGDENPADFLFAGVDNGPEDFLVRRKRAEVRDDEELARLRGGGAAVARRQTRARSKQMQTAKITSKKNNNVTDRGKRQALNGVDDAKSDSMASLVGSSQELSPRLATEYKEAFGGLQNDPGGALARFKRVKRDDLPAGSLD